MAVKKETVPTGKTTFTKDQILEAKKYEKQRDILSAVLSADKSYSHAQAEKEIQKFLKGKVN